MADRVSRILFILTLPLLLFFSSLQFLVFQPAYFDAQFSRYNIEEVTGIEREGLRHIMEEVMRYLGGSREDLDVFAEVRGEEREIFGEREKDHMVDVRELFRKGFVLRNTALIVLLLSLVLMYFNSIQFYLSLLKALLWGTWVPLALTVLTSALVAANFSYYFVVFHEIFFDNDLWLLDPEREILIQMLPEGFFMDTALLTVAISLVAMFIIGIISLICLRKLSASGSKGLSSYSSL